MPIFNEDPSDVPYFEGAKPGMGDVCVYVQHARKLLEHGMAEAARNSLLGAIDTDFQNAAAWSLLAEVYAEMDEADHAAEASRQAVRSQPENARLHVLKAIFVRGAGKLEEAKEAVEQALELDESLAGAHFQYSVILCVAGDNRGAVSALNRAVELEPGLWDAAEDHPDLVGLAADSGYPTRPASLNTVDIGNNPFTQIELPPET